MESIARRASKTVDAVSIEEACSAMPLAEFIEETMRVLGIQ